MSAVILLQVHFLVEDWEARMNDAEVELDQCITMGSNDALDGVEIFHFLSMTGRVDIGKLVEEFRWSDFAKRPLVGWALTLLVVIQP